DLAEGVEDGLRDALRVVLVRDVEPFEAMGRPQRGGHRLPLLGVDVRDDDRRAFRGEALRVRLADALPCAGDDRDLALQLHAVSFDAVCSARARAVASGGSLAADSAVRCKINIAHISDARSATTRFTVFADVLLGRRDS